MVRRKCPDSIASQLKGINCPRRPGFYTFFRSSASMTGRLLIRTAIVRWISYKVTKAIIGVHWPHCNKLAMAQSSPRSVWHFNATGAIERKRLLKEMQIEETVAKELEERRRTWDVNNGQFDKFSQWYIEYRKNIWHKDDYLPWLLYENEISCLKITFDVCEKPPRRINYGGRVRYTCEN
ncbi:hypothetical protein COOONC_08107 [Cooperia oncophora]